MNRTSIVHETDHLPQYTCQNCGTDLHPDSYGDYCPDCQRARYDQADDPTDEELSCWEPEVAEHLLTPGCCPSRDATLARADAAEAQRDYERGHADLADVQTAQSWADWCGLVAEGRT